MHARESEPAKKRDAYATLEALPRHFIGEVIDGDVVIRRLPAPVEAAAAAALAYELHSAYGFRRGSPSGWIFLNKPEVHLGEHVLVPNLAGWHQERLIPLPETPYVETVPDWVCEVLSPVTASDDRGPKRRIYYEAGVGHLWLLDPSPKLLEAFARTDEGWRLKGAFSGSDEVSAPPFDAISFSLTVLWPFDAPAEASAHDQAGSGG